MVVAVQLLVAWIVSAAGVRITLESSAPPQMIISLPVQTAVCPVSRRGPLVVLVAVQLFVLGLYRPPALEIGEIKPTPDDHFTAGPDCRVTGSARGRISGAGSCPAICAWIVYPPVFR